MSSLAGESCRCSAFLPSSDHAGSAGSFRITCFAFGKAVHALDSLLLKQYPNYIVELLFQLTCCGVGTSGDDSSSWLRAVLLCQPCLLFIYNKECDM